MLYPALIDRIMEFPFDRNVKISIKTNGFWGKNIEDVEKFIENIRQNFRIYR